MNCKPGADTNDPPSNIIPSSVLDRAETRAMGHAPLNTIPISEYGNEQRSCARARWIELIDNQELDLIRATKEHH
jgi:hypothetical protein